MKTFKKEEKKFIEILKEIENDMDTQWDWDYKGLPTYLDIMRIGRECRKLNRFHDARWCYDWAIDKEKNDYIDVQMHTDYFFFKNEEDFEARGEITKLKELISGALSAKANAYICEGVAGKPINEYIDCMEKAIEECDKAIELLEENEEAVSNKKIAQSNIELALKEKL